VIDGRDVHALRDDPPREPPASIRLDARLDVTTRQQVDDLATRFHQSRAAVLHQVMRWGLARGWERTVEGGDARGPIRHLFMTVDRELYRQMGEMAQAVGCSIAAWLRYWLRQVTVADFPAHWQAAAGTSAGSRSHDSRVYDTRFMLRLDAASETTLQGLAEQFNVPRAEIIRQLLAQATPDTFPASWHLRAAERHGEQDRPVPRAADHEG
jgi:predicted transcriptional regulator